MRPLNLTLKLTKFNFKIFKFSSGIQSDATEHSYIESKNLIFFEKSKQEEAKNLNISFHFFQK